MTRIISEVDRGTRTVDGTDVQITELVWSDDGRSFEAFRVADGFDLTEDECFDVMPSDDAIATRLSHAPRVQTVAGGHVIDLDADEMLPSDDTEQFEPGFLS